jgi:hypothetical protein
MFGMGACVDLGKEAIWDDQHTSICPIACGASIYRCVPTLGHFSSSATKASVSNPDLCPLSVPLIGALGCVDHLTPFVLCPLILSDIYIKRIKRIKRITRG